MCVMFEVKYFGIIDKKKKKKVLLKSPDVFLLHPFYRGCIKRGLVRTWGSQVSQNAFRTNQQVGKPAIFLKYYVFVSWNAVLRVFNSRT